MNKEEALEFIAQSVKSDVDMALVADAIKALEQESTTKNDLGVDCISRQAAIDAIRRIRPIDTDYDCTLFDKVDVMYVLNELPSVTPQEPRWIPVEERLPNDRDWYLGIFKEPDTGWINPIPFICDYVGRETKATTKEYWILRGCTDRDERTDYYFNLECVAWMPLPSSSSIDALIMGEVRKNDKRKSCL